jgi:hypothetical protein
MPEYPDIFPDSPDFPEYPETPDLNLTAAKRLKVRLFTPPLVDILILSETL